MKRRWWVPVLAVIAGACPPARSQTDARDELTVDAVRESIRVTNERTDLDDATKAKVLEAYQEALDSLNRATEWSAKAVEFQRARLEAPTRLEQIRTQLQSAPSETPDATVPADASLESLEQRLAQATADLKTARDGAASLDEERKKRAERRAALPQAVTEAKGRLDRAGTELKTPPPADAHADLTTARRTAVRARQQAIAAELASHEEEMASYDARGDLLIARRDLASKDVSEREKTVRVLQEQVNERRRRDAQAAAEQARQARRAAAQSYPAVAALAEENTTWAERRTADRIPDKIEAVTRLQESVSKQLGDVTAQLSTVRSKVTAAGLTHAMGLLLRRQRATLPSAEDHLRAIAQRTTQISEVQVKLIELEEDRAELTDSIEATIEQIVSQLGREVSEADRQEIATVARELLATRRSYVDALISDYNVLFVKLVDLDGEQRRLVRQIELLAEYINERILWVRSTTLPHLKDASDGVEGLKWLIGGANWKSATMGVYRTAAANVPVTVVLLALGAGLFAMQRKLRSRLRALSETVAAPVCTAFRPTFEALFGTALIAGSGPYVLLLIGLSLRAQDVETVFAVALGDATLAVAAAYFVAAMMRQLCRKGGLGEAHFAWAPAAMAVVRRELTWFTPLLLPLVFTVVVMDGSDEEDWQNSLGRWAFIIAQVAFSVFALRVLQRGKGKLHKPGSPRADSWTRHMRPVAFLILVGIPLALAALAVAGFYYTAERITAGVYYSLVLSLAAVVVSALSLRAVMLSQRKLGMERTRRRRESQRSEGQEAPAEDQEAYVDLTSISAQTRTILRTLVFAGWFVGLWFVWDELMPALGILDHIELWRVSASVSETTAGADGVVSSRWVERPLAITLQDAFVALFTLVVTFVAARNVPGLLEMLVFQRLPLNAGERYAIATVSAYVIWVIGLVLAFGSVGIGWSKVQWLVAAMTVGLGFGLQEIFANFISGLIILLERPIRVGDTVTVGDINGTVSRIRIRATTITDWNRKELVIPNKEFVTGHVVNWTLSDSTLRVIIPVGIAYGSDTELAERTLLDVASKQEIVLKNPPPEAYFLGFGNSSLDFELRIYIATIDHFMRSRHALHKAIDAAFREKGIEIAFPQRDLHVRSIKAALPLADEHKRRGGPKK